MPSRWPHLSVAWSFTEGFSEPHGFTMTLSCLGDNPGGSILWNYTHPAKSGFKEGSGWEPHGFLQSGCPWGNGGPQLPARAATSVLVSDRSVCLVSASSLWELLLKRELHFTGLVLRITEQTLLCGMPASCLVHRRHSARGLPHSPSSRREFHYGTSHLCPTGRPVLDSRMKSGPGRRGLEGAPTLGH